MIATTLFAGRDEVVFMNMIQKDMVLLNNLRNHSFTWKVQV